MGNWVNSKGNVEMLERLDLVKEHLASQLTPTITAEVSDLESRMSVKIAQLTDELTSGITAELINLEERILIDVSKLNDTISYQNIIIDTTREENQELIKNVSDGIINNILQIEQTLASNQLQSQRVQKLTYQRINNKLKTVKRDSELAIINVYTNLDTKCIQINNEIKYLYSSYNELANSNIIMNERLVKIENNLNQVTKYVKILLGSLTTLALVVIAIGVYHG